MERAARLNCQSFGPGATLSISGRVLQTGDSLHVDDFPGGGSNFVVKAFGLGHLVVETPQGIYELRPWHKGDESIINLPGPMSAWTVAAKIGPSK